MGVLAGAAFSRKFLMRSSSTVRFLRLATSNAVSPRCDGKGGRAEVEADAKGRKGRS